MLQIRNRIRPHIWYIIGNGREASLWYDTWDIQCPLISLVSTRAIYNAGIPIQSKVADVISNNTWLWPANWRSQYPAFFNINVPILNDQADVLRWRGTDGLFYHFSVSMAWNTIRERGNEIQWSYVLWSRYCIPRYAAHLWLVMRRRLKTQDRLRPWDVGEDVDLGALRCPLCNMQQDTHEHLFFFV